MIDRKSIAAGCRYLVFAAVMLLSVGACRAETMNTLITAAIDHSCGDAKRCVITMKSATDFEWDRVVIFTVGSSNDEVSKALGFPYTDSTDLMAGIVFSQDGVIVQRILLPYDPESPNSLSVKLRAGVTCKSFSASEAVFSAEKVMIDGKSYYVLGAPAD